MNPATSSDRIVLPNLNGIRFFAALSVIIFHVYGKETLNGQYGVVLFFVLSGFLITYLLLAEIEKTSTINIGKFYVRRVLRIWPLYYLVLFLSGIFIFLFHDAETLKHYYSSLTYYVCFLPNLLYVLYKSPPYANVLWSVGSEEQFYLFWPLLLLVVPRSFLLYALLFIIAVFTLVPHVLDYFNAHQFNHSENMRVVSDLMQRMCFNAMATGAVMALLFNAKAKVLTPLFHPAIQLGAITAVLVCWLGNYKFRYANDEIYSILFAIIICNMALNPNTLLSFNNRVLEYLGKISYGLYVFHKLVAFLVLKYIVVFSTTTFTGNILKGILVTAGTILVSAFSYEFFEKRFLKIKESRFSIIPSGAKN